MSRRPRPPSGSSTASRSRPVSGSSSVSTRRDVIAKASQRNSRPSSGVSKSQSNEKPPSGKGKNASHEEFGLSVNSVDVRCAADKATNIVPPKDPRSSQSSNRNNNRPISAGVTRVQFAIPDLMQQDNSYDLKEDPLPDAVFITDLPHDPHFHGYHKPPPDEYPLDNAFSALSEQISSMLGGTESYQETNSMRAMDSYVDTDSKFTGSYYDTDSGIYDDYPKSILRNRPVSASRPKVKPERDKKRPQSAKSYHSFNPSDYGTVTSENMMPDNAQTNEATSLTSLMEPVVHSLSTGKQIGGVEYEALKREEEQNKKALTEEQEKEFQSNKSFNNTSICMPLGMDHLQPYCLDLENNDASQEKLWRDVIGTDTSQCFVMLPCLREMNSSDQLRIVPPPQDVTGELDYYEKLPPVKPLIKTRIPIETPECVHNRKRHDKIVTPRIKVYNNDGRIVHETHGGSRNPDVVRQEIQELEDLMRGIGSAEGCVVVQLQAQINDINNTLDKMAPRLEEIRRREAKKLDLEEPEDHFGMHAFYRRHDDVIKQIRHQHRLCVLELSDIETEMGIATPRAHFKTHKANIRAHKMI